MPRMRPQGPRVLPAPVPADKGRCAACWTMRPVNDAGLIAAHQVRAAYEGQQPMVECSGAGQGPAGPVVHDATPVTGF
jgi:hypothetical protein